MKNNFIRNFSNCYLILHQNHLCFAHPDPKIFGSVLIKYKYPLRHIETQFDRSDPRILNILAKDKNNISVDLSVNFDDMGKTQNIKQTIEENKKSARNTEYLLLDSYFEDLINKMKF
jgi:hypothetical protein